MEIKYPLLFDGVSAAQPWDGERNIASQGKAIPFGTDATIVFELTDRWTLRPWPLPAAATWYRLVVSSGYGEGAAIVFATDAVTVGESSFSVPFAGSATESLIEALGGRQAGVFVAELAGFEAADASEAILCVSFPLRIANRLCYDGPTTPVSPAFVEADPVALSALDAYKKEMSGDIENLNDKTAEAAAKAEQASSAAAAHAAETDNPHGVTAGQIGAAALSGGNTFSGTQTFDGGLKFDGGKIKSSDYVDIVCGFNNAVLRVINGRVEFRANVNGNPSAVVWTGLSGREYIAAKDVVLTSTPATPTGFSVAGHIASTSNPHGVTAEQIGAASKIATVAKNTTIDGNGFIHPANDVEYFEFSPSDDGGYSVAKFAPPDVFGTSELPEQGKSKTFTVWIVNTADSEKDILVAHFLQGNPLYLFNWRISSNLPSQSETSQTGTITLAAGGAMPLRWTIWHSSRQAAYVDENVGSVTADIYFSNLECLGKAV